MKNKMTFVAILLISMAIKANVNIFKIDTISFDSVTLKFHLSWHADSLNANKSVQYGIAASLDKSSSEQPLTYKSLKKFSGDTVIAITDLIFDTSYIFGIWANSDGISIPPDSLSIKKVYVASSWRQPVTLFAPDKVNDTIRAINKTVIFRKDSTYPLGVPPYKDTVVSCIPNDTLLKGFIRLSKEVKFLHPEPSLPFYISMSLDSIPIKCKLYQIHIFRDSAGLFKAEDSSVLDIENKKITIKSGDIRLPLIVLADTTPPVIRILSDTSSVINTTTIYDTIQISDNTYNLKWYHYYVPGDDLFRNASISGILNGNQARIICPIRAVSAQTDGIRSVFIYSDGTYKDTISLSRRGLRYHSDPFSIPQKMIMPIYTTSQLDNTSIRAGLKALFDNAGGTYNKECFRIYRWTDDNSNAGIGSRWVEYSSQNENLFSITPGKLMWLISNKPQMIDLGKGTTVSLKDTINIVLPALKWTDLNNPFGFNLRLSDVLRISGIKQNDLAICKWIEDKSHSTYQASLVYNSIVTGIDPLHDTLYAMQNGYCVFNRTNSDIVLRFAPIPYSAGESGMFLKKRSQNTNVIKLKVLSDDNELGDVYCSVHNDSNDTLAFPLTPSFDDHSVIIKSQSTDASYSILSYPFSSQKTAVFNINIDCKNKYNAVNIIPEFNGNDKNLKWALYKKLGDKYEQVTNKLELQNGKGSVLLVMGTTAAIKSFTSSWQSAVPNVSIKYQRKKIEIRPMGIDKSICNFEIFTLSGQRILRKNYNYIPGQFFQIPTEIAAGIYVLKMKFTKLNETVFSMSQKISLLKEEF